MASTEGHHGRGEASRQPETPQNPGKYDKIGETYRRACICGRSDCPATVRRWQTVAEHDETYAPFVGYQYFPKVSDKNTSKTVLDRDHRRLCFEHLSVSDPSGNKAFIANHHFRLELLYRTQNKKSGNDKWVIDQLISKEQHSLLKVTGTKELYEKGRDINKYAYCVPSYNWNEMIGDLDTLLAVKERATFQTPSTNAVTPSGPSSSAKRNRLTPEEQTIAQLARRMESTPEAMAHEHRKLQIEFDKTTVEFNKVKEENKQLKGELNRTKATLQLALLDQEKLQKDGISRAKLISDEWHASHDFASRYLFGVGQNWSQYKVKIVACFFDEGVTEVAGGSGPLTPFEKVMMLTMKVKRNFDDQTIALIFGYSRQYVGQILTEWAPKLGKAGAFLTGLDVNFVYDYMSAEDCEKHGVPHYTTRHEYSDKE